MLSRIALLSGIFGLGLAAADEPAISEILIINLSHTDYGYTDHPAVFEELQRRYLDIALDAAAATQTSSPGERFAWTAESLDRFYDWWLHASAARRDRMLSLVRAGQIDVTALPFNNTPFLDRQQWDQMFDWVPAQLWKQVHPSVAVQDDVNGVPRAAALRLLDRGIHRLVVGLNGDSGGPPFPQPAAFWWRMPDGRRMFVWLGESYTSGYRFFEAGQWRRLPLSRSADTAFRPPRPGEVFPWDEASVRAAHGRCLARLKSLAGSGYPHKILVVSMTNQWRMDNDPPLPSITRFVGAWNRMGLKPALRLMTASAALEKLEREVGGNIKEYSGEWVDWWANGTASGPREVSASRFGKRHLRAAASPVFGPLPEGARQTVESCRKDLSLFDEHTWGSYNSISLPGDLDVAGQYNEKSRLAYRPAVLAEWLVGQRTRTLLAGRPEGDYVVNPYSSPVSGWVRFLSTALRDKYQSVEDPSTRARTALEVGHWLDAFFRPASGDYTPPESARFWIDSLPGNSVRALRFTGEAASAGRAVPAPTVQTDENGWPRSIRWPGASKPLFADGIGDFISVQVKTPAARRILRQIGMSRDAAKRAETRAQILQEVRATAEGRVEFSETAHTVVYAQHTRHPRLRWASRVLEVWKSEPRVRLSLRIDRIPSAEAEAFFVDFPLPVQGSMPRASNGGVPFAPFTDQLPNTCKDYFAVDSWVNYQTAEGNWFWVSRDAPLVTFGGTNLTARRTDAPADANRLLSMIYNNVWYTNFVADSGGWLEFQFDLVWKQKLPADKDLEALADSLSTDPLLLINPAAPEEPLYLKHLYRP